MPNVQHLLDQRVTAAMRAAYPQVPDAPAIVQPAQEERFGDYQANGAMALAKQLKAKPRDVAAAILARLDVSDLAEKPEIAGPGFINIRLKPSWVSEQLGLINPTASDKPEDDRLGVPRAKRAETIVVDYSAPNLAKEMHVGHLRSTIIGDALVRMLEFVRGKDGKVVRQNHVGDWGRQFGVVILGMWHLCMAEHERRPGYLSDHTCELSRLSPDDPVARRREALNNICAKHQADFDSDPDGSKVFRPWLRDLERRPVGLDDLLTAYRFVTRVEELAQGTDLAVTDRRDGTRTPLSEVSRRVTTYVQNSRAPDNVQEFDAWRYAKELTRRSCQQIYHRLGVTLTRQDERGESEYNNDLPGIVETLRVKGLLTESEGAQCVFLKSEIRNPKSEIRPNAGKPLFLAKDGTPLPLMVQKSDEGFLYATTDLAAIRYRVSELKADRILYVVDARQSLHFRMVFECARQAGFAPENIALVHVAFGTMMGPDGKPFKTREGGTVKLMDLLDEAEKRAYNLVTQKNAQDVADGRAPPLSEDQKKEIAHKVGIGAVKYADLALSRTSDYVFSWEKMLSLDGNTAPYMQYAYARIRSIFRKGGHETEQGRRDAAPIPVPTPQEFSLGKTLLRFPEILDRALEDYRPNILAAYLYDLAGAFTAFYDACPVIQSEEPVRSRRLKLCDLTARVIRQGLDLLGIETAERM